MGQDEAIAGVHGATIGANKLAASLAAEGGEKSEGQGNHFKVHIISAGACAIYAAVATFVILKFISLFMKLRTDKEEESIGLDVSLHGEEAYNVLSA